MKYFLDQRRINHKYLQSTLEKICNELLLLPEDKEQVEIDISDSEKEDVTKSMID